MEPLETFLLNNITLFSIWIVITVIFLITGVVSLVSSVILYFKIKDLIEDKGKSLDIELAVHRKRGE